MKTASKLKSICLSREEVQALQRDGRVAVVRKVELAEFQPSNTPGYDWIFRDRRALWNDYRAADLIAKYNPFGKVGERRWVKETAELKSICGWNVPKAESELRYAAGGVQHFERPKALPYDFSRAIGAACMPRWASRYTVEVESVAVEQRDGAWHWVAVLKRVED